MPAQPPAQGEAQVLPAIDRLRHAIRFSAYGVSPYTGMTSDLSTLIDGHVSLAAEVARLRGALCDAETRAGAALLDLAGKRADRIDELWKALQDFIEPAEAALKALDVYPEPVCTDELRNAITNGQAALTPAVPGKPEPAQGRARHLIEQSIARLGRGGKAAAPDAIANLKAALEAI